MSSSDFPEAHSPENNQPPVDIQGVLHFDDTDQAYLDRLKLTNLRAKAAIDLDVTETPDSLFRYLILEQEGPGRVNIFTMLTEDGYWNTILQKRRWAALACDTRVRVQLLERLRKAYTQASRKTIPAGMISAIDKTIQRLAS